MHLFYQPSLAVALQLMEVNDRDEPARHEPMEQKDNRKAFNQIKVVPWKQYPYAAIVIPGNGPELYATPFSPLNKMRLALAAGRYRKGVTPFLIVSGGYCYPFGTKYAEAVEMKKYLMQKLAIPEEAIIIDPYARRRPTTSGMPQDKPCVFLSTQS